MRKYAILFSTLLLCPFLSPAQPVDEAALLKKLELADNDSLRADVYIDLHNFSFKTDLAKSKNYAKNILDIGLKLKSPQFSRMGYLALARCAKKERNYDLVIHYDKEILKFSPLLANATTAVMIDNLTLARDYLDIDQVGNAEIPLMKCLQLSNLRPDSTYRARLMQTYGWYHFKQHETDAAVAKYKEALTLYQALKNEQMIAETKYALVNALVTARETETVPEHLFDAIEIYTRRNSTGRLGDCYSLLGQAYLINGNSAKGISSLEKAVAYNTESQNFIQAAIDRLDLGRCYLLVKDYKKAKSEGDQATAIFSTHKYAPGPVRMKTFWGQYFSAVGENVKADKYFNEAAKSAGGKDFEDIRNDNNRYWAQHRYKTKNNQSGDSLMLTYATEVNKTSAVNTAKAEVEELIRKNPELDKNTIGVIRLMFTEGGPELLKSLKGNRSLAELGSIEKFFAINPLSLGDSLRDNSVVTNDNNRLLELETKYNTRIKDDSLLLQKQNLLIEKANSKRKDAWITGAVATVFLLGIGFFMQYRFRKKADRDRATIELLQGEIHHRLTNNLAIIRRLVDVAGKNGTDKISLQSLQTRVAAIELLHKHLYSEKASGTVNLQEYFRELAGSVQTTFAAEKNVDILIDAPVSVNSRIAEKLGLIANEVITNSLKYAFPSDGKGTIMIKGSGNGKNYELKIADNGIGIPADRSRNFGLKMIAGLSKEIGGEYAFHNDNGTVFTLSFTDQKTTG
jgi:two-component system, sensor histidine kinase PdtaS